MPLLVVDGLTVGYRTANGVVPAVEDVSFTLEKGESLGLVGESGCGKTTLGKALLRLLPPNGRVLAGAIRFDGEDLLAKTEAEMREVRWGRIAMIFQAAMNALNPVHRVEDQIAEALRVHEPDLGRDEIRQRVLDLFRLVGIPEDRLRDYPHQYSGGMKQRAIIAMALACRPKLVIADEPTTALDVIVQAQILDEIQSLQRKLGVSLVFISHDIAVVADVCHWIGVMYAGHLVEYGPRHEVLGDPGHPYTRALLGSYPTLSGPRRDLKPIPGELPNLLELSPGCRFSGRCSRARPGCQGQRPGWTILSNTHRALCPWAGEDR